MVETMRSTRFWKMELGEQRAKLRKKKKKEKASTRMNQLILFLSFFFFFFFLYPFSQFSFFHRKSVESIEMGKENHLLRACHDFSQYLSSLFRSFSLEGNDTILSIRRDLLTDDQLLVYCFLLCVFFFRKKKKRERRNATQGKTRWKPRVERKNCFIFS